MSLLPVLALLLGFQGATGDRVDSVMKAELARRLIPGAVVAVVRDGKVVKLGTYGVASLELRVPVGPKTRFQIASATKNFTSVAVLRMVNQGKFALDDRLRSQLSWMPAAWDPVTVRQALSHTSGLPDLVVDPMVGTLVSNYWDTALAKLATMPAEPPGGKWAYNQTNYALIGRLVEKVAGTPFTQHVITTLFQPLGMTSAAFGDSRTVLADKTTEYSRFQAPKKPTRLEELINAGYQYPDYLWTAAGIFLDVGDIGRWMAALDGGTLLPRATIEEIAKPVMVGGKPFHFNEAGMTYDLGWVVIDRPKHRAIGGSGGGRSAYLYYLDDHLAVAVLTNLQGADPEGLVESVAKLYLPDLKPIE